MSRSGGKGASTDVLTPDGKLPVPAKLRLIVLSGPDRGRELVLEHRTYHVGKVAPCALILTDTSVSRVHLEIAVHADGVRLKDLDSSNGSFYRGAKFSEVTVPPGSVFVIGSTELKIALADEHQPLQPSEALRFGGLLGRSLAMRQVFSVLERVAKSDSSILIEGETGTGKELCAEAIHAASPRAQKPFVVCDLAGLPRTLIESELFGHKKGAFTGADRDRDGAFVQAHGGTIFIDELGELELELQPRLLRVLSQRKVKQVGGSSYRDVDVRVVAATNRDLQAECKAGRFREDLYHRLAVVRVVLPPLRERKEDIAGVVEQLLAGRDVTVPPETMALLAAYDWPGNVRELRNVTERALSMAGDDQVLAPALLGLSAAPPAAADAPSSEEDYKEAREKLLHDWERRYFQELLEKAEGNVSEAARRSGLDRGYLHRLLKKHGLRGI